MSAAAECNVAFCPVAIMDTVSRIIPTSTTNPLFESRKRLKSPPGAASTRVFGCIRGPLDIRYGSLCSARDSRGSLCRCLYYELCKSRSAERTQESTIRSAARRNISEFLFKWMDTTWLALRWMIKVFRDHKIDLWGILVGLEYRFDCCSWRNRVLNNFLDCRVFWESDTNKVYFWIFLFSAFD